MFHSFSSIVSAVKKGKAADCSAFKKRRSDSVQRFSHRRDDLILADDVGLELFEQIVAMVGIHFQGDGLGKIEAEDA